MRAYLESCPFAEKDAAKSAGAKWDFNAKKWYVPESLLHQLEHFNQWRPNGKMYLNCPFGDKDEAKKLGAKWDGQAKKWYFVPTKSRTEEKFKKWLPQNNSNCEEHSQEAKSNEASSSSPSVSSPQIKEVKSAKSSPHRASLPRINEDMTVMELQEECRSRDPGMRGLSGKNKKWFLNHLRIGSVWISASRKEQELQLSQPSTPQRKSSKTTTSGSDPKKKRKGNDTKIKIKQADKPPVKKAKVESIESGIASLLRIKPSMTLAQLSHELLHRDPSIRGTSNKNKQWFLSQLGVGSVWMSSTDASDVDFSSVPRVSSFMTIAQLSHEILERDPESRGLSGKNKSWFLDQLGVGSVWVTALGMDQGSHQGKISIASNVVKGKNKRKVEQNHGNKNQQGGGRVKSKIKTEQRSENTGDRTSAKTKIKIEKRSNKNEGGNSSKSKVKQEQASANIKVKQDETNDKAQQSVSKLEGNACAIHKIHAKIKAETSRINRRKKNKINAEISKPEAKKVKLELLHEASTSASVSLKRDEKKDNNIIPAPVPSNNRNANPSILTRTLIEEMRRERQRKEIKERNREEEDRRKRLLVMENIKNPGARHLDKCNKLKYTVWKSCGYDYDGWHGYDGPPMKEFDSSFDSVDEANMRVKYVFYYKNPWGLDRDEMHTDTHVMKKSGVRFLCCCPDDSERWTVSAIPSIAFDHINLHNEDYCGKDSTSDDERAAAGEEYDDEYSQLDDGEKNDQHFPKGIREPSVRHLDERRKLKYTVWTSSGGDRGYDHIDLEFDSSFDCIHEANERVKYVFYYKNPWGERDEIRSDTNILKGSGFRYITWSPGDSRKMAVSAMPSIAFDLIADIDSTYGKSVASDDEFSSEEDEEDEEDEDEESSFLY